MSMLCTLVGVIVWIALTGVGFFIYNKVIPLLDMNFMGQTVAQFFGIQNTKMIGIAVVSFFSLIGFLMMINMLLHALSYKKIDQLKKANKKLR